MWIGHRKDERWRFKRQPFVGANLGIVGCVCFIYKKMESICIGKTFSFSSKELWFRTNAT